MKATIKVTLEQLQHLALHLFNHYKSHLQVNTNLITVGYNTQMAAQNFHNYAEFILWILNAEKLVQKLFKLNDTHCFKSKKTRFTLTINEIEFAVLHRLAQYSKEMNPLVQITLNELTQQATTVSPNTLTLIKDFNKQIVYESNNKLAAAN